MSAICNTTKHCVLQPCAESEEFREQQCSAYNSVPYEGALLQWTAHQDDAEPCALACRGRPAGEPVTQEEPIVVQLAPKVQDGTRCRPGSLDMCINGKCQRVGCDLKIGSAKKVDACGVCGGDGLSCARPLYHWEDADMSLCSTTCGGGYKMSGPVCMNRVTGTKVEEPLCNASQRPDRKVVQCNSHRCPAKWAVYDWGPCSVTCGGGSRFRYVQCAEEGNGTRSKVPEYLCHGHKPRYQEPCNVMDCPAWNTGEWSGCSVSCGEGQQVRTVQCRDARSASSALCDPLTKPTHVQLCRTGIPCQSYHTSFYDSGTNQSLMSCSVSCGEGQQVRTVQCRDARSASSALCDPLTKPTHVQLCRTGIPCQSYHTSFYDSGPEGQEQLPGVDHTQPLVQPYPPPAGGPSQRPASEGHVATELVPSKSTFMPEKWGPCSVTCGQGFRKREVQCKIFLDFARTMARLPDGHCQGPKPSEVERCVLEPCSAHRLEAEGGFYGDSGTYRHDPIRVAAPAGKTYTWKQQGFTHCSASCLGGVQESLILCVRDGDQKPVSPYLCPQDARPEALIRTCNDHPCPPRWNYSDFQPCTKSCGVGFQTREVNCIHEVTRGGSNTVIVPNNMCPQPPPIDRQYCNVLDCPIHWHTSEWTKCSKSCGGGIKTRLVECKQVMAQNHVVLRSMSKCPPSKPADKKPCNTRSCVLESDRPHIATSNHSYVQQNPSKKKVTLKIGGQATVFWGTQIKIKCPVKRFNRTKIQWAKDHNFISNSKKYKISKKGALRIQDVTQRDGGTYTCLAGQSSADLVMTVKPRPGEFPSSEEIDRQNMNHMLDRTSLEDPNMESNGPNHDGRHPFPPGVDDLSHELRPESNPLSSLPKKPSGRVYASPPTTPALEAEVSNPSNKPDAASDVATGGYQFEGPVSFTPPRLSDSFGEPPSRSGGSRPMPHFQKLLANLQNLWLFQTFGNSRGHRMVSEPTEQERLQDRDEREETTEDTVGSTVILGKGSPENLKFDWMITDWSKCSQSCGGSGFQVRAAHCMVRLHNTTQNVDSSLCEDAGLPVPPTLQKCGTEDCPHWVPSDWSPCEESRCFTWNTAMQRREVGCQLSNGTEVDTQQCSEAEKPLQRQECYSDKCKGTWKVGEWSECVAACETQGIKYRILQCVWYGTKKPAGNACRDQPRPSVMKVCKGLPCAHLSSCKDQSKYCQNVKAMNMCRVQRYQHQCCQSCRNKG
ncbi:ADAMTS-like protein 1 [Zootermopsis nevadensis]|uniref:ADAMTS-like protein 1 n=1 Tax=Zootermopsis nevadensis TaxID=136037 RepID=UPI000B8E843E|nr:ADAMTS-like protein 1 [Zootermopsis nevadensis]